VKGTLTSIDFYYEKVEWKNGVIEVYIEPKLKLPKLKDGSVVVIASKIISICQGNIVRSNTITKYELLKREADYYLPENVRLHINDTSYTLYKIIILIYLHINGIK
jgi:F420-0:gamma-glutamyl ligase-like protein